MTAFIISKPAARLTLRSVSMTALMAMTLLVGHTVSAKAESHAEVLSDERTDPKATTTADAKATAKAESVEDRIASLHDSLKVTAGEEADWKVVADVMRTNAAEMEKLVADKAGKDSANMTAVDDLKNYEVFAQAHVTGLKKLISAFDTLYTAMPPAQKKVADQVFMNSRHERAASHG